MSWISFKNNLFKTSLVALSFSADALGGAFVLFDVKRILYGKEETIDFDLPSFFGGLTLASLTAIPMAIGLWQKLGRAITTEPIGLLNTLSGTTPDETTALIAPARQPITSLKVIYEAKNFIFKGIPFGLLDFGGCYIFTNKMLPDYHGINLVVSSLIGFASSLSNYFLTRVHEHDHPPWLQMLRQQQRGLVAIQFLILGALTLAGHLFQTFLELEVFDESVSFDQNPHDQNFWLEESLTLSIAALATACEGYAKLCASVASHQHLHISRLSKALTAFCLLIQLLLPAVGSIRVAEFIYKIFTTESFLPQCAIGLRGLMLLATAGCFGFPNIKSSYHMNLETVDSTVKHAKMLFFKAKKTPAAVISIPQTICDNNALNI